MKKGILFLLIAALFFISLPAQQSDDVYDNSNVYLGNEITIQKNIDFQTALKIIEKLSLSEAKKNIINMSNFRGRVPFPINNTPWRDALRLITTTLGLVLEEKPGAFVISDVPPPVSAIVKTGVDEYNIHDKMVRINATFLVVDKDFSNEAGINWNSLFNGRVNANIGLATDGPEGGVSMGNQDTPRTWDLGPNAKTTITLDALLRFIESNKKGDVIARPTITVLNGKPGYIQVGEDFSVKQIDESGNTVDKFYSVGVILNVTPVIIEEDGFEAIYLNSAVENSEVTSISYEGVRMPRSQATSDVLLFDGEETVIGGLLTSKVRTDRRGIPILKNLPWWAFGFLFGYSSSTTTTSEMIVILKVEIVSPAMERIKEKESLRETYDMMKDSFETIKEELFTAKKTAENEE